MKIITQAFNGILISVCKIDRLDLVTILTLVLLILHSPNKWYLNSPIIVLSISGLIFSRLRKNDIYWFLIASLLISVNYFNWFEMDNHKYLLTYWSIVLFCVFLAPGKFRYTVLECNARILIGLVFLFATIWKLISLDYLDFTFFEYNLLIDSRFEHFAVWLTDISNNTLLINRQLEDILVYGYLDNIIVNSIELQSTDSITNLAIFMTLWTVIFEAILAILFFLPNYSIVENLRNVLLLVFAATTYFIAPVIGFGWLLMIMGLAQSPSKSKIFPFLYILVFVLIQFYTIPYGDIVRTLFP